MNKHLLFQDLAEELNFRIKGGDIQPGQVKIVLLRLQRMDDKRLLFFFWYHGQAIFKHIVKWNLPITPCDSLSSPKWMRSMLTTILKHYLESVKDVVQKGVE